MGKKGWSDYTDIPGTSFKGSVSPDKTRITFKDSSQSTNYPHTTVDVDRNGNIKDYHYSESPKGQKFGLGQLINSALQVSGSLKDKLSDINQNGIDI